MSEAGSVRPSTAGTSVLDLFAAYRALVGKEAVDATLASLPDETRRVLTEITNVSWVPVDELARFIDAVAERVNRDAERLLDEAVREATERTFKTVWRVLLRFTSDEAVLARTPIFYAKSRNIGRLEARMVGPGRSEVILSGWPGVSTRHIRTLGVSMETVIRLAGRQKVRATWEPTGDGARYALSWQ
jgi:hypothetical protein